MQATLSEVEKAKVIEQVDGYRVCEPLYEAVRIVLTSRGETCSPQYVQGISGAAFRVAGICPCAPTCGGTMAAIDLAKLLGYDAQTLSIEGSGVSDQQIMQLAQAMGNGQPPTAGPAKEIYDKARPAFEAMLEKIRSEVRAGRAVVVWHAFTNAENDVVVGYDDAPGEWIGRGSYVGTEGNYGRAPQMRMFTSAAVGGLPSVLVIGAKSRAYDANAARAAELAALREAVRHARDTQNVDKASGEKWVMLFGIAAYDRWVKDWQKPEKKRTAGDSYCYGIYRSTHRAAGDFLREIAPKYSQSAGAQAKLLEAAGAFTAEADALDQGQKLLWWDAPEGPDAARNAQAAKVLAQARDHYVAGIQAMEQAIGQIDTRP